MNRKRWFLPLLLLGGVWVVASAATGDAKAKTKPKQKRGSERAKADLFSTLT